MVYSNQIKSRISTLFILSFVFLTLLSVSDATYAVEEPEIRTGNRTYTLLEPIPCVPDKFVTCPGAPPGQVSMLEKVQLNNFFQYAFNLLIAVGAAAAVFMMTWGGFLYVSNSSAQLKSQGRQYFENAIKGLLMLLGAFLILKTVNPKLVEFPTNIPAADAPAEDTESLLSRFDRINADVRKYNNLGQEYVNEAKKSQLTVSEMERERADLSDQLILAQTVGTAEEQDELIKKISNIDEDIKNEKANLELYQAKSIMNNGAIAQSLQNINMNVSKELISPALIEYEIATGLDEIEKIEKTRSDALSKIQAYDQITKPGGVNDSALAAKLTLQIQGIDATTNSAIKQEAFWNTFSKGILSKKVEVLVGTHTIGTVQQVNADLTKELSTFSAQINTVRDPQLKADLQNLYTKVLTNINTKFK